MFYFFFKKIYRVVWTVLALFSLCYLQYGASIFSISWKIAIFFFKFWSVSSILSFPITMLWNISTVSLIWNFFASHFLWDTVILFITTTFLIYLSKFASIKFLLKSLSSYFRIPFTQGSNSIFSIPLFVFLMHFHLCCTTPSWLSVCEMLLQFMGETKRL